MTIVKTNTDSELIERLRRELPNVSAPAMRGDNLCITLASFFEPLIDSDEMDDSGTWKQGAIDASNEVMAAIHSHYAVALAEAEKQRDRAREYGVQARIRENAAEDARIHEHDRAEAAEAKLRVAAEALRPFAAYGVSSIGMDLDGYVMKLVDNAQEPTFADFDHARVALSSIGEV
jgi:hypothetical protein